MSLGQLKPAPPECPGLDDCEAAKPIHTQLAELRETLGVLDAGQRVLERGHETLVHQMAELIVTQNQHAAQLRQLTGLPEAVAQNTELTREVLASTRETREMVQFARDAQAAGRFGARVARAGSKVALGVAALITAAAGAWWAIKGGVPPPKP